MNSSESFIHFLQSSITPVALISGVGLLLLTITNRLGRTIDRTRQLVAQLDHPETSRREVKKYEIHILYRRSRYLRNSIATIIIGIISSSLIIPLLFVMSLYALDLRFIGYVLFILSIFSILLSCIYFFRDVLLALNALKLEAQEYL
ncbi:MAG: DUF2721 domain-containing protein [Bacteroidales bacterium]|nr:DUF2721 domain-containing protein [Bacteroidales bacterium]